MHSLTVCFGPTGTVWTLLFKSEDSLEEARATIAADRTSPQFVLKDDFGQALCLTRDSMHGFLFEDMDQSQMAQVERGLHQARSQAKAQTRAMADPVIKESLRAQQQGPAVMSPVPGGRFS